VRERIGDAEPGRPLVADESIAGFLVAEGTTEASTTATETQILRASVFSARIALASMLRLPDRSIESLSITRARIDLYRDFVLDLERQAGIAGPLATMSAGGISIADDALITNDTDYPRSPIAPAEWERE
jgi:hypothetical protein